MQVGDHLKGLRAPRARCRSTAVVASPEWRRRSGGESGARYAGVGKMLANRAEATATRGVGVDMIISGARRRIFGLTSSYVIKLSYSGCYLYNVPMPLLFWDLCMVLYQMSIGTIGLR